MFIKRYIFSFVLLLLLVTTTNIAVTVLPNALLTIYCGDSEHNFSSEIAKTTFEQSKGLMFRDHFAANQAMVFLLEEEAHIWMKNTIIPLDIIFVASNNKINKIVPNVPALSKKKIGSDQKIKMVIELKAGTTEHFRIKAGDVVKLSYKQY